MPEIDILEETDKLNLSVVRETKRIITKYITEFNEDRCNEGDIRKISTMCIDMFSFFGKIRKKAISEPDILTEEMITFERNFVLYARRISGKFMIKVENTEDNNFKKTLIYESFKINDALLMYILNLKGIF